jgi:hypothetical protein
MQIICDMSAHSRDLYGLITRQHDTVRVKKSKSIANCMPMLKRGSTGTIDKWSVLPICATVDLLEQHEEAMRINPEMLLLTDRLALLRCFHTFHSAVKNLKLAHTQ